MASTPCGCMASHQSEVTRQPVHDSVEVPRCVAMAVISGQTLDGLSIKSRHFDTSLSENAFQGHSERRARAFWQQNGNNGRSTWYSEPELLTSPDALVRFIHGQSKGILLVVALFAALYMLGLRLMKPRVSGSNRSHPSSL